MVDVGLIIGAIAIILAIVALGLGGYSLTKSSAKGTTGPPGAPGPSNGPPGPPGPPGAAGATAGGSSIGLNSSEISKLRNFISSLQIDKTLNQPIKLKFSENTLIGLGTDDPQVPLQISSFTTPGSSFCSEIGTGNDCGAVAYNEDPSCSGGCNVGISSYPFSIVTKGPIGASTFVSNSDKRIKTEIESIPNSSDLIDKIEPKRYKLIDENKYSYGLIAQDVKNVIPDAIKLKREFIPNVHQILSFKKLDENRIVIDLEKYDIKIEDKIKMVSNNEEIDGKVIDIKEDQYIIETNKVIKGDNLFVYGKQVNDYHVLDYNYLFTLNLDATKKLQTKIKAMEDEIKSLKK